MPFTPLTYSLFRLLELSVLSWKSSLLNFHIKSFCPPPSSPQTFYHVSAAFFLFLRVMVLKEGTVAEFDSPSKLLSHKGLFYLMAKDAGIV